MAKIGAMEERLFGNRRVTPLVQHLFVNTLICFDQEDWRRHALKYNPGRKWSPRERRIIAMIQQDPGRKDLSIPANFEPKPSRKFRKTGRLPNGTNVYEAPTLT